MGVGDRVRRRNGGSIMEIVSIDGRSVTCRVLGPNGGYVKTFDIGELVLADEPEDEPDSGASLEP